MVKGLRFWQVMAPRRRRWVAAGAALAVAAFVAAGQVLPDWGLRWGVLRGLRELGWSRVGLGDADIALFDGAVVIRQVVAGSALGEALGIGGLDLTFRWKPLFSRRVSLEQLDLDGVEVDIRRDGAGFVVNGLPVAVGASTESGAWTFDVTSLRLRDSRIRVHDGAFAATIAVETLDLHDLKSWDPAQAASFRLAGTLNGSRVVLAGTATPFAAQAGFSLKIDVESLDLAPFADLAKRAGLAAPAGRLSADLSLAGGRDGLTADGRLDAERLSAGLDDTTLAAARLGWQGSAQWRQGIAKAAGSLRAGGLSLRHGGVAVTADAAELTAKDLAADGRTVSWDGALAAEGAGIVVDGVNVESRRLGWSGPLSLDLSGKAAGLYHAEGRAEAEELRVRAAGSETMLRKLAAEGSLADAPAQGVLPPLLAALTVSGEGLAVAEPGRDLLSVQKLEARDLRLAAAGARVARLDLRGLAALGRKGKGAGAYPWRAEARSLILDRVGVAPDGGMSADSVGLGGTVLRLTRTKDGLLGLASGGGEGGGRPRLQVGRLRLASDARLEFEDRTLSEPVRLAVDNLDVTVADLDSDRPDRDSPFTLRARVGAAQLAATGKARPFAARPGGEMTGDVRALELPPLSPYAADALGVHLHTGQLDAEIALSAKAGKLDGTLQLALNQLFVAQPDPAAPLAKQADMPLETVLDLLRDGDNRIKLTIPVRGDLDSPDFDVSDAVNQAIGGALKSTVFTTLKVAFPVAALIGFVIDEAENPRLSLEPLAFPAGADSLGEAERAKLSTVAGLLGQRPGLKLNLCGIASQAADWPVLMQAKREEELGIVARLQKLVGAGPKPEAVPVDRDRLSGLADARAQAAKSFLIDQAGIDPGRLFTCRPRIETEAKASPRVDLLL